MNLQAVYNAPGTWVVMRGTPTEYNVQVPNQYGPFALGKIADDAGQIAETMFTSGKTAALPQESLQNVTCTWAVKYDANSGRLNSKFNAYAIQGQPAPRPSSPPQSFKPTPARPQAPQQPVHVPVGRDAIDPTRNSIESQTALNRAVDLAIGRKDLVPDLLTLCLVQGKLKTLIQTGAVCFEVANAPVDPFDAAMAAPERQPGDDDPFR